MSTEKRVPDADPDAVYQELKHGGPWLGAARRWSQRYVGDHLKFNSREHVSIPFVELWDLAQCVAAEAIREERKERARETLELKERWRLERENERLSSELVERDARIGELKNKLARRTDAHDADGHALMRIVAERDAARDKFRRLRAFVERRVSTGTAGDMNLAAFPDEPSEETNPDAGEEYDLARLDESSEEGEG